MSELAFADEVEDDDTTEPLPGCMVVVRSLGNHETPEGKKVASAWSGLVGRSLPLVETPDMGNLRTALIAEFPYAGSVIDPLVHELSVGRFVRLRPLILVGAPGSGKSLFATRLLYHLGIPHQTYACGAATDGALAGCSRRWTTGEPSLPIALIRRNHVASPGIILDEVDKVAEGRMNGSLLDSLLALLEPRTAARFFDVYLETDVDLSRVVWLGTANGVGSLPAPLRDRCRIVRFPAPRPDDLPPLASNLMRQSFVERDLDPRWATPLTGSELEALRDAWKGGSVRRLGRLVDAVLIARDRYDVTN